MSDELSLAETEILIAAAVPVPSLARKRDLGGAILLAAIDDYRSMDEEVHLDAKRFLYPQTADWRDQYEWAVGLTEGVNAAWLRDALDRLKPRWDADRFDRMVARRGQRCVVCVGGERP